MTENRRKPVLFAGTKPLNRAENLKAVFDAYDGEKKFVQVDPWRHHTEIRSGKYDVMVCDEYPTESPGTAILIGHGFAGGKTGGLDQPYPYMSRKDSELFSYVIASGTWSVPLVANQCSVAENQVLPLGMPRTDAYVGKHKGDGGTALARKRAYLYAPTYRTAEETPLPEIDWEWLDGQLTDEEMIAVKPHTMTGTLLKRSYRHIQEIPAYEPSAPYLYDCDVVISDYSTIIFDGYLLEKPSVLFDRRTDYLRTRGMYLRYPGQYSSRFCQNEPELLENIREASGLTDTERECLRMVADMCDGHATERVCELIRSLV